MRRTHSPATGKSDEDTEALTALADVGLLRRLLDQAELAAVGIARRHGKSWAEIAVTLGVTRQSAWERWRVLDDDEPAEIVDRAAADVLRRRGVVRVPNVIGMSWDDARGALVARRLVAVGPDPDAPPLTALGWPDAVVTDQSPESGARVPVGSAVTLWVERGGGSGVREPRRPKPLPRAARGALDESSGEAVG
jgi:PASTA domain